VGTPLAPVPHSGANLGGNGASWSPLDWLISPANAETLPPTLATSNTAPVALPTYLSVGGGNSGVGPVDLMQPLPDSSTINRQTDWSTIASMASNLKVGSSGDRVAVLQTALGIPADRIFGPQTEHALREAFVQSIYSAAQNEQATSGVPAAITTAQAIQETGYGRRVPIDIHTGEYSYNLFGVKARGDQEYVTSWTHENVDGRSVSTLAKFASYGSFDESISGHTSFLTTNQRYAQLFNSTDPVQWAAGLQQAHYATDPNYATKLINVMRQWNLR